MGGPAAQSGALMKQRTKRSPSAKYRDVEVLVALVTFNGDEPTYVELGRRARVTASQAYASVKFLRKVRLVSEDNRVNMTNFAEFMTSSLKYSFRLAKEDGK